MTASDWPFAPRRRKRVRLDPAMYAQSGVPHMDPMAQDFYAAFTLGADDKHINTIDLDGVALAAPMGSRAPLAGSGQRGTLLRPPHNRS